jgi:hypothetical protein
VRNAELARAAPMELKYKTLKIKKALLQEMLIATTIK